MVFRTSSPLNTGEWASSGTSGAVSAGLTAAFSAPAAKAPSTDAPETASTGFSAPGVVSPTLTTSDAPTGRTAPDSGDSTPLGVLAGGSTPVSSPVRAGFGGSTTSASMSVAFGPGFLASISVLMRSGVMPSRRKSSAILALSAAERLSGRIMRSACFRLGVPPSSRAFRKS